MKLGYPWLFDTVRARFDSDAVMEAFLPKPLTDAELAGKGDDSSATAGRWRPSRATPASSSTSAGNEKP